MADSKSAGSSQPKTIEIINAAKKAFDPSVDIASRQPFIEEYQIIIDRTETWVLLPTLNALIKPNVLPPWLRESLMHTLTHLPLRSDGVRSTLEFVFSVHPSNKETGSDSTSPQKEGASITHEAIAVATKLLSSAPVQMSSEQWFQGISGQMFALMDGNFGPDLAKTAAQIIGFGILGRKQFGAPGSPGWKVFVEPLLNDINPSLGTTDVASPTSPNDDIVDLTKGNMLVRSSSLHLSLQRLHTLIISNPSPGLCRRVLKPIFLQLWVLASWINPTEEMSLRFCKAARDLFQTYLRLFGNTEEILLLISNLLCQGSLDCEGSSWRYCVTGDGSLEIVSRPQQRTSSNIEIDWSDTNAKAASMTEIVGAVCSAEDVSSVFLKLLRRWIQSASKSSDICLTTSEPESSSESALQELLEVAVLQKLLDNASDKLVSHFNQLLDLVCQVLRADNRTSLDDDLVAVVLSLLNLIITAASFQKSDMNAEQLKTVEDALARIAGQGRGDISTTAQNLSLLLRYRDEMDDPENATSAPTARQVEDRRTYNLAMSYITGKGDNPPPVVSEGLKLLSDLILAGSPVLDVTAVTALMSNLLKDNEDYINLQVIRTFTQLAGRHPKSTINELLDHYLDAGEKASTDERLRFGEALTQTVERLGETFAGDMALNLGESLLSIAGRRGYRPRTMAKQNRKEKTRRLKEAKRKGAVEEEDNDIITEDMTEEDQARNEILAQITQGWESKRGSEDVRMRTSALSIFGAAVETNISGMGPNLVSAGVDLSISVLILEPELEKGILRRAAILMILSFVRALDLAKELQRGLGFGLTEESRTEIQRTLEYVADTDNDGLVQQHAKDVMESLENWSAASILSRENPSGVAGLSRLAGLQVNPGGSSNASGRTRPRIEEIE